MNDVQRDISDAEQLPEDVEAALMEIIDVHCKCCLVSDGAIQEHNELRDQYLALINKFNKTFEGRWEIIGNSFGPYEKIASIHVVRTMEGAKEHYHYEKNYEKGLVEFYKLGY